MRKVLITGTNSYIGTSFMNWIISNNKNMECSDVSVRGENWKGIDFSGYTSILHVAGIAHVNSKTLKDEDYYIVNTDLTVKVAEKAKAEGVSHFVFMSSIIVFNDSEIINGRITKDTVPYSKNSYGNSKIKAEQGIKHLEDDSFKVSIIRPPMIYGPGSKGNYPRLAKIARLFPVFPDYTNKRSMLYIENLSQFLFIVINDALPGIFHPQNNEYVNTTVMVQEIAKIHKHRLKVTKIFNPVISFLMNIQLIRKVFGNLYYEDFENLELMKVDFVSSISKTELV